MTVQRVAGIVIAVAALACVVGAVVDPARAAISYLAAYVAVLGIALGALAVVMIAHLTGATWFVLLRRRAEDVMATLPVLALLFVPVVLGVRLLYPWAVPLDSMTPVFRSEMLKKLAYLNIPFFTVRAVIYWITWIALAELLRRASLRQDRARGDDREAAARRMYVVSAVGIPAFALTATFAAIDWIMSLSPTWVSTIYGVYVFAGDCVAAVALLAVLARWGPRHAEPGVALGDSQFQALGKLLLTFVMFWAYTGYVQYLIIWSGDVPSEVTWYVARSGPGWRAVATVLVGGHFALPFLALLPRAVRRDGTLLAMLGAWLLVMHFVDAYWLVLPAYTPGVLRPHWLDIVAAVALAGIVVAFGAWRVRREDEAPVPVGDPDIAASRHYQLES